MVKPRGTIPRERIESVIVDNGAFSFYQKGFYPPLPAWIANLLRKAWRLRRLAEEVIVVLPDYVNEPSKTVLAARRSMRICKTYKCMVVMHYNTIDKQELESLFETYIYDVEADLYALPLKLPTSTGYSAKGRKVLVDEKTQLTVLGVAADVARRHGVQLHLLAPSMTLIKRLWVFSDVVRSIDTTSWTRAVNVNVKKQLDTISARSEEERELLFTEYLDYVCKHVGRMEAWGCAR